MGYAQNHGPLLVRVILRHLILRGTRKGTPILGTPHIPVRVPG